MGNLNEHFRQSGYTLHRTALRKERLPQCCRENLRTTNFAVQFLNQDGREEALPLTECSLCGKKYAMMREGKFLPIKNTLQFEIIKR